MQIMIVISGIMQIITIERASNPGSLLILHYISTESVGKDKCGNSEIRKDNLIRGRHPVNMEFPVITCLELDAVHAGILLVRNTYPFKMNNPGQ